MLNFIKKVPLSIIAIFLALLTLGNLLLSYSSLSRIILGSLAGILLLFFVSKLILYPEISREDLNNPLIASVLPGFSMGLMVFSSYLSSNFFNLAYSIWIFALIIHFIFILVFSRKFVINFKIYNVYPTWFIVYVGICTAAIVSPDFGHENLGKLIFYFALVSYCILMPLNIYRCLKIKGLTKSTWPSIGVFTSPASLCLAAYVKCFDSKNLFLFSLLLVLSQLAFSFVLSKIPRLFESDFHPSLASFTFPIAISALALKLSNDYLISLGYEYAFLQILVKFEEAVSISIVFYVLIRYLNFIFEKNEEVISDLDLDLD